MVRKFLNSTLVYAGSALMFSIGRQIVFLPTLNKISPELFIKIGFLIILTDFLIYAIGASIADYYVKKVHGSNKEYGVYRFLFYFSYLSLSSYLIFYFYDMSLLVSFVLSVYLLFYVFNTLQMKLFFNNLKFSKNYGYVFLRLIPYISLLFYEYSVGIESFLVFTLLLLIFEVISYITFRYQLKETYKEIVNTNIKKEYDIFGFILLYLSFSLVLRLDMFVIEYFYEDKFAQYYQMISVYMIGVTPIILLTSASLLSILTHVEKEKFIENKYKILLVVLAIATVSGVIFHLLGEYIVKFLYPENEMINNYTFLSFIVIFTTLLYQILKTFIIKYSTTGQNIIYNIIVITIPLLFIVNFLSFIYVFFILRAIAYVVILIKIK